MNRPFYAAVCAAVVFGAAPATADGPTFTVAGADDATLLKLKSSLDGVKPLTAAEKGAILKLTNVTLEASTTVSTAQPTAAGGVSVDLLDVFVSSSRNNFASIKKGGSATVFFSAAGNRRYLVDCVLDAQGPVTVNVFLDKNQAGSTSSSPVGGHVTAVIPLGTTGVRKAQVTLFAGSSNVVWRSCEIIPVA